MENTNLTLGNYVGAMNNTARNRGIQRLLDKANVFMPKGAKLFAFQHNQTICVEAVAMKGCSARFVGGNYKKDQHCHSSYNLIEGALSNHTGFGMYGEVACGKYIKDDVEQLVRRLKNKMPFWKRFFYKVYLKYFF